MYVGMPGLCSNEVVLRCTALLYSSSSLFSLISDSQRKSVIVSVTCFRFMVGFSQMFGYWCLIHFEVAEELVVPLPLTPSLSLQGHLNNKGMPLEASFSPDSQFIFSGSTDGRVHVWNAETGYKVRMCFYALVWVYVCKPG